MTIEFGCHLLVERSHARTLTKAADPHTTWTCCLVRIIEAVHWFASSLWCFWFLANLTSEVVPDRVNEKLPKFVVHGLSEEDVGTASASSLTTSSRFHSRSRFSMLLVLR
jgi:hypothetical protein